MRYNFSPSQLIIIYVIFVWSHKRFNCNDICNNRALRNYENIIIENDTYRYSLHYNYSMRIRRNQSQPVPSKRFKGNVENIYGVYPRFSFSYYGKHVQQIDFHPKDNVYVFEESQIGIIINYMKNYENTESPVVHDKELLGVKRNFLININDSEVTATMITLLHPNGKVSFYYDNIPTDIDGSKLESKIVGTIRCGGVNADHGIPVPAKWIKSGTLVEFESIGEICSQYNTIETCQRSTTLKTTCIWCEKGEKCIESNNPDTHVLKVNDCSVEKKSDVNDLNSSTTTEHSERTLGITEVQTTKTTDENKQHKSHWYLYVVIPLVASLFLICIGCIIWRWLLRRKRSNE
ncbi:egg protein CP391S-like [Schistosoma mansoni]|uniref:egg protein CP391S-like n=2 Tax=Schistosoma mansoni TaxID=6183 RepID=UPI0001A62D77|nr:egg protein CP391S-like [Schistosoma mansoni]|eukprot:XP_018647223.1 egg protein CP391S-like [Schistosoma mansoni]